MLNRRISSWFVSGGHEEPESDQQTQGPKGHSLLATGRFSMVFRHYNMEKTYQFHIPKKIMAELVIMTFRLETHRTKRNLICWRARKPYVPLKRR